MLRKHVGYFGLVSALCAMVITVSAFAGSDYNMADTVKAWAKEYNAGNLAGVRALYAEDGCRMPPNASTAQGADAILAQLQGSKDAGPMVKLALTHGETSGDLGYATGTWEVMGADGSSIDHGKWMNVSKRVNGGWKIQCDIWNSDQPLPTGEM